MALSVPVLPLRHRLLLRNWLLQLRGGSRWHELFKEINMRLLDPAVHSASRGELVGSSALRLAVVRQFERLVRKQILRRLLRQLLGVAIKTMNLQRRRLLAGKAARLFRSTAGVKTAQ